MTHTACAICGADVGEELAVVVDHLIAEHARATDERVSDAEVAVLGAIAYRQQIPYVSERDAVTLEGLAQIEWRGIADRSNRN